MSGEPAPPPRGARRRRLRREVLVLLPASTLLLIALSTVTLFTHRNTVARLLGERREEAARLAWHCAAGPGVERAPTTEALRACAPLALGVALLDARGAVLARTGVLAGEEPLAPLDRARAAGESAERPLGLGPDAGLPDVVAGFAPVGPPAARRFLRLDLAAAELAARARGLRALTAVVLGVDAGVALLLVFFLRHLLAPYEALLARARTAAGGAEPATAQEEVDLLVSTFERALAALARPSAAGAPEGQPAGEPREDMQTLERTLGALGELAAGVAHELRNSVATLRGYLTLIARRPSDESLDDYLSEIRRETEHLERVLEDFLAFARPGSARLEELDLERLARRAAADPVLAGVPVRVAVAGGGPRGLRLRGDPQLLERALRNVLHNAAQAEREAAAPGAVEVELRRTADGAEVVVADHGRGVPEEIRERLFHPFTAGRPGGVGLGLALAHRIIDLHRGRLRLEDRPGGGTRAVITFAADSLLD